LAHKGMQMLMLIGIAGAIGLHAAYAQASPVRDAVMALQRGEALYEARCTGCHSVDVHRVGPAHAGVYGRKAGSAAGYAYSVALKASNIVWKTRTLDDWLRDPEAVIPGQRMGFSVEEAADRADLIAYLKSLPALMRRE
jgi:cytochrome c